MTHARGCTCVVAYARPCTRNVCTYRRTCRVVRAAAQQRLARGLGSIGHSYGNVSNYRTELLAEDPVGQPVSGRDVEGRHSWIPRSLVRREEERAREGGITALRQYPRLVRCR